MEKAGYAGSYKVSSQRTFDIWNIKTFVLAFLEEDSFHFS